MASIKSTGTESLPFLNALLYGRSGIGKTVALSTAPNPFIISAENGLGSIIDREIPYSQVSSLTELQDCYRWLTKTPEGLEYETICIDSLSAVCDFVYTDCRERVGSQATVLYPELRLAVIPIIRAFCRLPRHFIATAHETHKVTQQGIVAGPSVNGGKLTEELPYLFDQVFHYTMDFKDKRTVLTDANLGGIAKDRSGKLPAKIDEVNELFLFITDLLGE